MEFFNWDKSIEIYAEKKNEPLPLYYDFYNVATHFKNVYEPADDTFLLIDSIANDITAGAIKNKKEIKSIELGCGNGLVSCCYLGKAKENLIDIKEHYCVDINKDAIELTKNLIEHYEFNATFIESNLFDNVDNKEGFDVIIFNPPYVTTDDDEYQRALKDKDIYASWAGGKKGSETIFKFLDQLKNNIKQNGILYLLLSKENEYHTIISRIKNECGFDFDVLMKKRAKNERLAVFKFYKK